MICPSTFLGARHPIWRQPDWGEQRRRGRARRRRWGRRRAQAAAQLRPPLPGDGRGRAREEDVSQGLSPGPQGYLQYLYIFLPSKGRTFKANHQALKVRLNTSLVYFYFLSEDGSFFIYLYFINQYYRLCIYLFIDPFFYNFTIRQLNSW